MGQPARPSETFRACLPLKHSVLGSDLPHFKPKSYSRTVQWKRPLRSNTTQRAARAERDHYWTANVKGYPFTVATKSLHGKWRLAKKLYSDGPRIPSSTAINFHSSNAETLLGYQPLPTCSQKLLESPSLRNKTNTFKNESQVEELTSPGGNSKQGLLLSIQRKWLNRHGGERQRGRGECWKATARLRCRNWDAESPLPAPPHPCVYPNPLLTMTFVETNMERRVQGLSDK